MRRADHRRHAADLAGVPLTGIRTRYYLLEESGALKRVARRIVDGLASGADTILKYAA